MNRKLSYLFIAMLSIGIFACKKDSDTALVNPATIDGSQISLPLVEMNLSTKLDSLVYYADADTSMNSNGLYLKIQTLNGVALKPGTTYKSTSGLKSFSVGLYFSGKNYRSRISDSLINTITINSISAGTAAGSYSAKVWSSDSIPVSKSISGNF